MNKNMTIDNYQPDFADVAAATAYSIVLITILMMVAL